MNTRLLLSLWAFTMLTGMGHAQKNPSFEEVISLEGLANPVLSPDGRHVAFEKTTTDWAENRFDRELWLSKDGGAPIPLTHNPKGSSQGAQWSPDGQWLAFVSDRGNDDQIYLLRTAGGEAFPLTDVEGGVGDFEWRPDGAQIAFLRREDQKKAEEARKEKYGAFEVDDAEYRRARLWVQDVVPARLTEAPLPEQANDSAWKAARKPRALIDSVDFHIRGFKWSPDGRYIAFTRQPDPLINSSRHADISIYDVASGTHRVVVGNPSSDTFIDWSPDSRSILFGSAGADTTSYYYKNSRIFRMELDGSGTRPLAADFDEDLGGLHWTESGIYGTAWQKTRRPVFRIDPATGRAREIATGLDMAWQLSFDKSGKQVALLGRLNDGLWEVRKADTGFKNSTVIASATPQIEGWATAQSEVVQWQSQDGATIEGVLHKPRDYDPAKKYPLLVVIHGGPTGISAPEPVPAYVYPMVQWLNKGALVLRPNYRGSAGYGEAFRSLNVRNLGVGDAWDVLSGVAHLEKQGLIDPDKVGCMGWSQGGYISAFLATNSDKFKAFSVGAGISNWVTYYVNTDIHPFTRQYLQATPWEDMEIYQRTSPMTNINNASTPTLIQHGENDRRVPIPNAYELLQGLRDVGVPAKLVVYKGFGHGITKPKERLAAMWHNWQWFGKYLWGEEIELPE
ncbi:S9 family peptidase [Robiginitalea marina]|uniref:S9 family peptidase n=1 Tax=Robiginitalea marina TaxID=2954105 RepID=A0ABT1B1V1_9FLAO|nr:S9 family peptidase [Robiginitalea marina]MCO5725840.1 S9 family peptidase [Robiginitalea marina]